MSKEKINVSKHVAAIDKLMQLEKEQLEKKCKEFDNIYKKWQLVKKLYKLQK